MTNSIIHSCSISPYVSADQFIPEHFFLYLVKGSMTAYDGSKEYPIKAGDYGIGRKNNLAKYSKQLQNEKFEKVVITFDRAFLQSFNSQYKFPLKGTSTPDAVIPLKKNKLVKSFIHSLTAYFNDNGKIDTDFFDLKRTELLLILLKENPSLADIFFDFGIPEKIDLEEYMNRNYKFNVAIERFAYLTGRSLSSFKRDFQSIFNETPGRWLMQKRLREAHFLIGKKNKKPSAIYIDLGFEDLSHFSFAFKKMFGVSPNEIRQRSLRSS